MNLSLLLNIDYIQMIPHPQIRFKDEKIRFFLYGSFNTLLSNIVLQIFLLISQISIATLICQFFNLVLGYFLYGKKVFGIKLFSKTKFFKYCLLAVSCWQLNWLIIGTLTNNFPFSSNISAIIGLPFIACWSYLIQKYFIFRK